MNTNMKELNLNELEQANGGCLICLACIASTVIFWGGVGTLVYLSHKKN